MTSLEISDTVDRVRSRLSDDGSGDEASGAPPLAESLVDVRSFFSSSGLGPLLGFAPFCFFATSTPKARSFFPRSTSLDLARQRSTEVAVESE